MHVVIRDVKGVFFDGFVKEVILPGEDGELSIWDFHQTLVSCLREGDIILGFGKDMPKKSVHINAGVAKFERSELGIMCL
jgi:F0F1-type ATP synthase epsilon subunit